MKRTFRFVVTTSIITISSLAQAQVSDEIPVITVRERSSQEKIESVLSGQSVQSLISDKSLNVNLGNLMIRDEILPEDGDAILLKKGRKVLVNLPQGKIEVSGIIRASGSDIDLSKYTSEQQSALSDLLKNGFHVSYVLSDCKNTIFRGSDVSADKVLVVCNKIDNTVRNSKSQNIADIGPKKESDEPVVQQQAVISFTGAKLSKNQIPALKKIAGKTMINFKSENSDTLSSEELGQLINEGLVNEDFDGSAVVQIRGASIE